MLLVAGMLGVSMDFALRVVDYITAGFTIWTLLAMVGGGLSLASAVYFGVKELIKRKGRWATAMW